MLLLPIYRIKHMPPGLTNPKADFITGQKNMLMRVPLETRFKEWETR